MRNPIFHKFVLENHNDTEKSKDCMQLLCKLADFRILDMVLSLRQQRHPGIVQTKQQYNFIYSALVDEICKPTTISEACCKAIQWSAKNQNDEKQKLNQSGPVLKSYEKEKSYNGFLEDNTSNDLAWIFNKKCPSTQKEQGKENDHPAYLISSGNFSCQERSLLCKSSPMVFES